MLQRHQLGAGPVVRRPGVLSARRPRADGPIAAGARRAHHPAAGVPRRRLLRAQFRAHRGGRRALEGRLALALLARALRGDVGELLRRRVGRLLPDPAGAARRRRCAGRGGAAADGLPPGDALVARPRRRRPEAPARRQPALHVDHLRLLHRDRGQGRRDQRPHPSRAGLRDGPGAGAGRDRRADPEGDRGGGAAARHRQAGHPRAHPQQAGQADAARVRDDEDARRHRRRHPRLDRLPLPGGADRPRSPRALERQGLSARAERRGDSDRCAHSLGGRLLRRADLRSPLPAGAERRRGARDHPAEPRDDVRPGGRGHVRRRLPRNRASFAAAAEARGAAHDHSRRGDDRRPTDGGRRISSGDDECSGAGRAAGVRQPGPPGGRHADAGRHRRPRRRPSAARRSRRHRGPVRSRSHARPADRPIRGGAGGRCRLRPERPAR